MTTRDILYARYELRNLKVNEQFLFDFGLTTVHHDVGLLRMRAAESGPWVYEAQKGEVDRFLGMGFLVESRARLDYLATLHGSSPVRPLSGSEQGSMVRMRMPDGFEVDAVFGIDMPAALGVRKPFAFNTGHQKLRINASVRQRVGIVPALRLGHVVLHVRNHGESVAWLCDRLGLMPSDHFGPPTNDVRDAKGTFLRVDHGEDAVDHHCLLVLESSHIGCHHISFELQDLDHLMAAHEYLLGKGWKLDCGVGRHLLGSQIYDYWLDPAGFRIEHYTDGDAVNHEHKPTVYSGTADETTQWGMAPSKEFFL